MKTYAQDNVYEYIKEFPNQEQVKMMNSWLKNHEKGTFSFTGLVDPTDATVVIPQATVDYGYNWFCISDGQLSSKHLYMTNSFRYQSLT